MCGGLDDESAKLVKSGGDHARACGHVPDVCAVQVTAGADVEAGDLGGSDCARRSWEGDAARVARARHRIDGDARRVRRAARAACTRTPSPGEHRRRRCRPKTIPRAVRAVVRHDGQHRSARTALAHAPGPQHSRRRHWTSSATSRGSSGPATAPRSTSTSKRCATSSAASQMAEKQNSTELPLVEQPLGVPSDYAQHAKLMMDLLALAYQSDLTRISTFMLAREISNRAYPGDRRLGFASSAVAPPGQADQPREAAQDQRVPLPAVRVSHGEAGEDSRRETARCSTRACSSTARDQRQQHAFPRGSADRAGRRQAHRDRGRPLRPKSERDADREPVCRCSTSSGSQWRSSAMPPARSRISTRAKTSELVSGRSFATHPTCPRSEGASLLCRRPPACIQSPRFDLAVFV